MKKKIAILGSTGSIGTSLLEIVEKKISTIDIILLTADTNYKLLIKQAKKFKVKNLIITDLVSFKILKEKKYKEFNIYNNFESLKKIFPNKIDYIMSSITGINGLDPTYKCIKYTNKIAIANKESIICGWNLLKKELIKNKTIFVPVDSEHFSIWSSIKNINTNIIEKIFITASGGPFYNLPYKKFNKIKVIDAIKHPNWSMGKKISVDSSTMMNKVFEIIEAKKIFNLDYNQLEILIHRNSYLHAIVKLKNGISQMIVHDTDMKIPIFNSIYYNQKYFKKLEKLDIKKLNNLSLNKPNIRKFPLVKILNLLPNKDTLFETVLISINDTLVDLFLNKKISFNSVSKIFFSLIKDKKFLKYKKKSVNNINQIIKLNKDVQLIVKSRYT